MPIGTFWPRPACPHPIKLTLQYNNTFGKSISKSYDNRKIKVYSENIFCCVYIASHSLYIKGSLKIQNCKWRWFHFWHIVNYYNILYSYLSYPECISSTQIKPIFNRLLCRKLSNIMRIFFAKKTTQFWSRNHQQLARNLLITESFFRKKNSHNIG